MDRKRRKCIRCKEVATEADLCAKCIIKPRLYPRLIAPFPRIKCSNMRLKIGLRRFHRQGPATTFTDLAVNSCEVYSLENTTHIPCVYRFSIADPSNNIWLFDIRSIYHLWNETTGSTIINPYNRSLLSDKQMNQFHTRITWLLERHYDLTYTDTLVLTPRQIYMQRITETFVVLERLGYTSSTTWFERLSQEDYHTLYNTLFTIWNTYLMNEVRCRILPQSNGNLGGFPDTMDTIELRIIDMMWRLITEADETEDRTTGAIYCLIALSKVSEECAAAYDWLQDEIHSQRQDIVIRIEDSAGAFQTYIINGDMFYNVMNIPDTRSAGPADIQRLLAMYPQFFGGGYVTPEYIIPVARELIDPRPTLIDELLSGSPIQSPIQSPLSLEDLLSLPFLPPAAATPAAVTLPAATPASPSPASIPDEYYTHSEP